MFKGNKCLYSERQTSYADTNEYTLLLSCIVLEIVIVSYQKIWDWRLNVILVYRVGIIVNLAVLMTNRQWDTSALSSICEAAMEAQLLLFLSYYLCVH